jgi:hypothetical protein
MTIFDPTASPVPRALRLPARPTRLDGLRLGLVENTKFNSDTLLLRLAARLRDKHGATVALLSRKRSPSHSIEEGQIDALKNVSDLVISGIGD